MANNNTLLWNEELNKEITHVQEVQRQDAETSDEKCTTNENRQAMKTHTHTQSVYDLLSDW